QLVPSVEVVVDQPGAHPQLGGDVGDPHVPQAPVQGHPVGRLENLLTALLDVDARARGPRHQRAADSAASSSWWMWATPDSCSVESTPSADSPASYVPCRAWQMARSCSTTSRVAAKSAARRS